MRALIIDDSDAKKETLKRLLANVAIEAIVCGDLEAATVAIATGKFDIVFIDDRLREAGRNSATRQAGISIPRVRSELTNVYIVAYTSTPPSEPGYFDRLRGLGADFACHFEKVLEDAAKWPDRVGEHRANRLERLVVQRAPDLGTRAAVESVGEQTLQEITLALLGAGTVALKSLSGGLSGDVVFHAAFTERASSGQPAHHVLKLSRSATSLDREFRGAPSRAALFQGVGLDRVLPDAVSGWWAGSGPLVPNAKTLEDAIGNARSAGGVVRYSRQLWNTMLCDQITSARAGKDISVVPASLSAVFVDEVRRACGTVSEALRQLYRVPKLAADVDSLAERVSDREGAVWPFRADEELWSYSHGDFHARNVLLQSGSPVLIDWARASEAPRCVDCCCIMVDLLARVPFRSLKEQWSIESAKKDVDVFAVLLAALGSGKVREWRLQMVADLLRRMSTKGVDTAEIARACAFHFLRYARFESLPLPRRAFCALSAARIVEDYKL